jgi:gliding motility-associated-like protein
MMMLVHRFATQMKVVGLILAMIFVAHKSYNQETPCDYQMPKEATNWIFGERAFIQFNNGTAVPSQLGSNTNIINGVATISDAAGDLLFVSDGINLWSSNMYLIQNTNDLDGNNYATQSALFVPQPGNIHKYYLFAVDMHLPPIFNNGITYTTIERISGSWTVTMKNQLLHRSNAQKIVAVKHADDQTYWVITHGYGSQTGNSFFAYRIDEQGLSTNPVVSSVGATHQTVAGNASSANNNSGYMRASPNGTMIALTIPADGIIELFDFNRESGQVSNVRSSGMAAFDYPYGLEFSPDNTKLYATTTPIGQAPVNSIYQFDLQQANPFANPYIVDDFIGNSSNGLLGALQLGVDGRIYVALHEGAGDGKPNIAVIYNPNRPGSACNYNHLGIDNNGLNLNGGRVLIGFPNFVSNYLDVPHFRWTNHCHTRITAFSLRNDANVGQISWDFGDGSAFSGEINPQYTFDDPGSYVVRVTETYNGQQYSAARELTIFPLPILDIGQGSDTLYILPNSSITLDAGEFDEYLWEPSGTTERYLDVDEEGWYRVTVTDTNCCKNSDTVYVAFSNIFVPTAFKPNSLNDNNRSFRLMGATSALENFKFYIFNRWGELVFETTDPKIGWDGKLLSGHEAPQGVYIWALYYESTESRFQPRQYLNQRGVVTLMR